MPPPSAAALPRRRGIVTVAIAAATVAAVGTGTVLVNHSTPSTIPPAAPGAPGTRQSPPPASPDPFRRTPDNRPAGVTAASRLSTFWGIDVSWPQCDPGGLPQLDAAFVVVGVNNGRPFTDNPCLAAQVAYAGAHSGYATYLNLDAPRAGDPATYGRQVALDGLARARAAGLRTPSVWLDVEVLNHWADGATNVAVINAALHALQSRDITAGIYSSVPMWQQITGGAAIDVPVWLATTVTDYRDVDPLCQAGLGGHAATMAQYVATTGQQLIDVNVLCAANRQQSVGLFAAGKS